MVGTGDRKVARGCENETPRRDPEKGSFVVVTLGADRTLRGKQMPQLCRTLMASGRGRLPMARPDHNCQVV